MAITLIDFAERLNEIGEDLDNMNVGQARIRLFNLKTTLTNSGIMIHAVATIGSKKVDSNDRDNQEE